MEADHDALAAHLDLTEPILATSAGELLGPAVARGLDVGWGRVVGPEPNVVLVVTGARVVAVRRHPGGLLDAVVWTADAPEATPQPAVAAIVVWGRRGDQVVFRPVNAGDLDRLGRAIPAPPTP